MTPQSHFTIIARLASVHEQALRDLLATMNTAPGVCDPHNALVPFAQFKQLHVARFFVVDDPTLSDRAAYGVPPTNAQKYLIFLGDCDGPNERFLRELATRAGDGLRKIFTHCEGFTGQTDLYTWLRANDQPVAATYVNWVGRTVTQVLQEDALQRALTAQLARMQRDHSASHTPQQLRSELVNFARAEIAAGRLMLTPTAPTPLLWWLRKLTHAIAVPLLGLAALPVLLLLSPILIYLLRSKEQHDPELAARPSLDVIRALQHHEDHDVTNQFSAVGTVKPGMFRRMTIIVLLFGLDYACRHIYTRGHLTRVQTIHFARWAFFDNGTRLIFASNYDGSLEAYMDDFINKVGWGLNLVFSNGMGYPHTDWLVMKGSRNEQRFKSYLRRHQLQTDVWYKAYPGLTAVDLARNGHIRAGMERGNARDHDALEWLRLL